MPKRWEYLTLECASLEDLNALGAEGWELVGRLPVLMPDDETPELMDEQKVLVFKREN